MKIFLVGELLGIFVMCYAAYHLFKIYRKLKKKPAGRMNYEKTIKKIDKYRLIGMAGFTFYCVMGLFQTITRK